MIRKIGVGAAGVALAGLFTGAAAADGMVYADFPVTVKGYQGKKTTSVSYAGQIARHALHDSLKKLAASGNGKPNPELKARMMAYFSGKDAGRKILAPASKGRFAVKQGEVDCAQQGQEPRRQDLQGRRRRHAERDDRARAGRLLDRQGVVGEQGVRRGQRLRLRPADLQVHHGRGVLQPGGRFGYLDEYLRPDKSPNDKPYKKGAAYTGKEHAWDEAFGYFGTPAHTLNLTPKQVYDIAKRKDARRRRQDTATARST